MARLRTITFKNGSTNFYDYFDAIYNPYNNLHMVTGISGMDSPCLYVDNIGAGAKVAFSSRQEIYAACRIKMASKDANRVLNFTYGSSWLACVTLSNYTRQLCALKGALSPFLAAGTTIFNPDDIHYIEVYYKADSTNGRFVVKIDGITEIDFTGSTSTGSVVDGVWFGASDFSSNQYLYYDRIIVAEEWPGPLYWQNLSPTGEGNSTQWTPVPSPNWDAVNAIPHDDSQHVRTNTVDQLDTYQAGDLAAGVDSIKALTVWARVWKESTPTPTQLKVAVRSSGSNYLGNAKAVGVYPTIVEDRWETNPATQAAWTPSEVNGVEIGVQSIA
jgi:hypothetical protein